MSNPASTIILFSSLASLVLLVFTIGTYRGPATVRLGTRSVRGDIDLEKRRILLRQYDVSFWLLIASGVVFLSFIAGACVLILRNQSVDTAIKVFGLVCGLGDSALLAFLFKVWRAAGKTLGIK